MGIIKLIALVNQHSWQQERRVDSSSDKGRLGGVCTCSRQTRDSDGFWHVFLCPDRR